MQRCKNWTIDYWETEYYWIYLKDARYKNAVLTICVLDLSGHYCDIIIDYSLARSKLLTVLSPDHSSLDVKFVLGNLNLYDLLSWKSIFVHFFSIAGIILFMVICTECSTMKFVLSQRASHVYSEARRVHEFRDTVLADLRCILWSTYINVLFSTFSWTNLVNLKYSFVIKHVCVWILCLSDS